MNFGVYSLQLVLAALLHASALKAAHIPKEGGKSKNEVIPFLEVFKNSECKPRDILVDIIQERPEDVDITYIPSCVVLSRCAGCCGDEALECVPVATRNVTMEVLRLKLSKTQHNYLLTFTEHTDCRCRPKQEVKEKKENRCEPCSERRKRLFVQDPLTCKCSCKFTQLQCKSRQLELNERTCRCDKPRR